MNFQVNNAIFKKLLSLMFIFLFIVNAQGQVKYSNTQKIVVYKDNVAGINVASSLNPIVIFDYPDRQVFILAEQEAVAPAGLEAIGLENTDFDDMNKVFLRNRVIDTTQPVPAAAALEVIPNEGDQLYLIQFAAPVKDEWLDQITIQGNVEIISYIPSNAYLIWTDGPTLSRLKELAATQPHIQWMGPYESIDKANLEDLGAVESVGPAGVLGEPTAQIALTVQFFDHDDVDSSISIVRSIAQEVIQSAWTVGPYKNLRILVLPSEIGRITALPDVVNVEPWIEPTLFGERQGQILANKLNTAGNGLSGPGYLEWLNSLGFNNTFDFSVNITDSGFDSGQITTGNVHPDFLDVNGNSRITYVQRVFGESIETTATSNIDTNGHGTIDHAIVGGFNNRTGSNFEDGEGYNFGLGVAPFVRLGSSRIFAPGFTFPNHIELTNSAYARGARISSNSWGATDPSNSYDTTSQDYDRLVRDSRPEDANDGGQLGNQEMVVIWAAGNHGLRGEGTLGDNGATAKNTIVVGASESLYQTGLNCFSNTDADNANEIAFFSSRGPNEDGRFAPHIMAPGIRIQGAAPQHSSYNGIPRSCFTDRHFPTSQTFYTLSAGTSQATPAVAGAAALLRQWFLNKSMLAPSPAMTKAYLMNSTTYMTGAGVNDNLPSNNQGMGRLNLERAFDNALRILVDQDRIFTSIGESHIISGSIVDNTKPFRVTLVWTDPPSLTTAGRMLVNDLDLEVTINDGSGLVTYRGNRFIKDISQPGGNRDRINNVESVWLPAGTMGNFTVTIHADDISGDGVPNNLDMTDQDFALVVYNASILPTDVTGVRVTINGLPSQLNDSPTAVVFRQDEGANVYETLSVNSPQLENLVPGRYIVGGMAVTMGMDEFRPEPYQSHYVNVLEGQVTPLTIEYHRHQ